MRFIVLLAVLAAEALAVSMSVDALPQVSLNDPDSWLVYLGYSGMLLQLVAGASAALLLLAAPRLPAYAAAMAQAPRRWPFLLPASHLLVAAAFFAITTVLFSVPAVIDAAGRGPLAVLWFAAGTLLLATWGLLVAPLGFWAHFFRQERRTLLLALAAAAGAILLAHQTQYLWDTLAHGALLLAHAVLSLRYDHVVIDPAVYELGVGAFIVTIGRPCSGYEGIALISVFTGLYLYIYRSEFRFPRALWLFPIGIATIWLFNVLRIALLIGIGVEVSPRLALEGFHSQAGWIAFLLVSSAMLYGAHRFGFARTDLQPGAAPALRDNLAAATVLPLVTLLAAGLVTGALTDVIDWLYPVRAVAGLLALAYVWHTLALPRITTPLPAVAVGVVVAGVWLLLATPDPARDAAMAAAWEQQQPLVAWSWLVVRVAAAVLLVPLVEELVFRGYLLARLGGQPLTLSGSVPFQWLPVVVSSAVFGILHDAWVAGFVAGFAYALLRCRSRDIWAPVTAHAVTNLVLAALVSGLGSWSIW